MTPIAYRPDIDGLRAVAVLAVVLFHADVPGFSGGFTGVDVFFVISGYLITSIIVRELGAGTFSLARFYERRFRRILPALSAVALVALAVGFVLLHPRDLRDLGTSMIAAAGFGSNIHFYLQADYFARPTEFQPLLHTWSLAVEEQFYIFFPLLMAALARRRRPRFALWLTAIAVGSFAAGLFTLEYDESAAFYLIHARAWELMLGSLVALHVLPQPTSRLLREALTVAGLAAIGYGIAAFDKHTPFPGTAALAPTLGTAAVIYAGLGGTSLAARALSLRPAVWVGLLSYSLYLWHWPLIVYAKYYTITGLTRAWTLGMLALAFAASYASWRWIEQPARHAACARRGVLVGGAAVIAAMAAIAVAPVAMHGFPQRFPPHILAQDPELETTKWEACTVRARNFNRTDKDGLCRLGGSFGEPTFMLWGDSHAGMLAPMFDAVAQQTGTVGVVANRSACPPLLRIDRTRKRPDCSKFNDHILAYALATTSIRTVFLAARWSLSAEGTRYGREFGSSVRLVDLDHDAPRPNRESFEIGVRRTLAALNAGGKRVVVIGQVPEVGIDVPAAYVVAYATGRDLNAIIAPTRAAYEARNRFVHRLFEQLDTNGQIAFVNPSQALCDSLRCIVTLNGAALYLDDDHLSAAGTTVFKRYLQPYLGSQDPTVFQALSEKRSPSTLTRQPYRRWSR